MDLAYNSICATARKEGATFSSSVLATQEAWNYWDSRDDR